MYKSVFKSNKKDQFQLDLQKYQTLDTKTDFSAAFEIIYLFLPVTVFANSAKTPLMLFVLMPAIIYGKINASKITATINLIIREKKDIIK